MLTKTSWLLTLSVLFVLNATNAVAALDEGTVVIYSNGNVEKLIKATPQGSLWEDAQKRRFLKAEMPILPVTRYERFPSTLGGFQHQLIKGDPRRLLPYGDAEKVNLVFRKTKSDGTSKLVTWRCVNKGVSDFAWVGGNLKTDQFICDRVAYPKRRIKETLMISYSRKLGLVVDLIRIKKDRERRKSLALILTPDQATPERISAEVKNIKKQK